VADEEQGSKYGIEYLIKHGVFKKDDLILVPDGGNGDGSFVEIAEKGKETVNIQKKNNIKEWTTDFVPERTTIWNFETRGDWAVHTSEYRGNWPPQLPRNLILKYTKEGDLVLDQFVGGGTTLIEAYLLNRKSVGIDISRHAIRFCNDKIAEMETRVEKEDLLLAQYRPLAVRGDACKSVEILKRLGFSKESVDLVCAHPPYMNSITYTRNKDDLSSLGDVEKFIEKIGEIARQSLTLLKKGGICSILIGDVRKESTLIPLGLKVMNEFLNKGFTTRDVIVKIQHKDRSTEFYRYKDLPYYLLDHEYLLVFSK
jgi:DNA modification methylase